MEKLRWTKIKFIVIYCENIQWIRCLTKMFWPTLRSSFHSHRRNIILRSALVWIIIMDLKNTVNKNVTEAVHPVGLKRRKYERGKVPRRPKRLRSISAYFVGESTTGLPLAYIYCWCTGAKENARGERKNSINLGYAFSYTSSSNISLIIEKYWRSITKKVIYWWFQV